MNSPIQPPQQRLVQQYLNNTNHSLHARRTLDEYYYHTLADMSERDKTQTGSYYQERNNIDPQAITMVDQLWLWVLRNTKDGRETVVSCFPDVNATNLSRADVIDSINRYMRDEPTSIQSAYDLAGLIAAKCSRIYLDKGSTLDLGDDHRGVLFSEIYETAIGDVVSYAEVVALMVD
jgi:hypothetical protein